MFYCRVFFLSIEAFFLLEGSIGIAGAQSADVSQLEQLGRIQDSQDARRVALQEAQHRAVLEQSAAQRQAAARRAAASARQVEDNLAMARARSEALAAKVNQENREHLDDRSYLDANRLLDLQKRQLELKIIESKATHADEYVQQELNQHQVSNDMAQQSLQADNQLKADIGQAVKISQKHWWQW